MWCSHRGYMVLVCPEQCRLASEEEKLANVLVDEELEKKRYEVQGMKEQKEHWDFRMMDEHEQPNSQAIDMEFDSGRPTRTRRARSRRPTAEPEEQQEPEAAPPAPETPEVTNVAEPGSVQNDQERIVDDNIELPEIDAAAVPIPDDMDVDLEGLIAELIEFEVGELKAKGEIGKAARELDPKRFNEQESVEFSQKAQENWQNHLDTGAVRIVPPRVGEEGPEVKDHPGPSKVPLHEQVEEARRVEARREADLAGPSRAQRRRGADGRPDGATSCGLRDHGHRERERVDARALRLRGGVLERGHGFA